MSPDIEWRIGEEAEQETVVHSTYLPRSRRRWAVIMVIGLGVGLGLLYRSIPEPPPRPIAPSTPLWMAPESFPLPSPTATVAPAPEALETAIRRDALLLATLRSTDEVSFDPSLSLMPQAYADWYAALLTARGRWAASAAQPLYTVLETGTLPSGVVWVAVEQLYDGDVYHQTRFYRRQDDGWTWTLPDWSFWQGATAAAMSGDVGPIGPLTIGHPMEDASEIGAVFERFTHAYLNLCESLKCPPPANPARLWTPGLTLTLTIQPTLMQPIVQERRGKLQMSLPSPRVVGYYQDAATPGDPFVAMAYDTLIEPVVRLASGNYARWETDRGGELFLQAIATWKRSRVQNEIQPPRLFYAPAFLPAAARREYYRDWLQHGPLLPLDALWDWPTQGRGFGLLQHVAVSEVEAIIAFLAERHGEDGLVHFLNALGKAHSLEEAIETALPVTFEEFNRQWRQWISED